MDYAWWGGLKVGTDQYKQFITVAEATAVITKDSYGLSVVWDDAVRLYVDAKLIVDQWIALKYQFGESPIRKIQLDPNGNDRFRVELLSVRWFCNLISETEQTQIVFNETSIRLSLTGFIICRF